MIASPAQMASPAEPSESKSVEPGQASGTGLRAYVKERVRTELVLGAVALAIVGALIVAPHPTYPSVLPLPEINEAEAEVFERAETARAVQVKDGSLDKRVRIVGEYVRRVGYAGVHQKTDTNHLLDLLRKQMNTLLSSGHSEELLQLRALQAELFIEAAHQWALARSNGRSEGRLETELEELGGDFRRVAEAAWLNEEGRLVLSSDEMRLLFRIHWGKLTGVFRTELFGPSLPELKRYHLLFLVHPPAEKGDWIGRTQSQLKHAEALGKIDVSYPTKLAQGMLHLKLGQSERALGLLQAHLQEFPTGAWAHLASNHLLLAKENLAAQTEELP